MTESRSNFIKLNKWVYPLQKAGDVYLSAIAFSQGETERNPFGPMQIYEQYGIEGLIAFVSLSSAFIIGATTLIQKLAKKYNQQNLEKYAAITITSANVIALLQNAYTAYHLYFT